MLNKCLQVLKEIGLYLWQLPQNLLGLIFIGWYKILSFFNEGFKTTLKYNYKDSVVRIIPNFPGGISLGRYIFINYNIENMKKHEYGHCRQSKRWGPLYLPVPGATSFIHNINCRIKQSRGIKYNYYGVWPENEADKLGGVVR